MMSRIISAFFLLSLVAHQTEATRELKEQICDLYGIFGCSELMRTCEVNDDGTESCGNCLLGHIEFKDDYQDEFDPCVDIAKITWSDYRRTYEPTYNTLVNPSARLQRLLDSARISSISNLMNEEATYTLGLTPFSADSADEYQQRAGYFHVDAELPVFEPPTTANADVSPSVDWVADGAVKSVKDQGRCAASWAIAACGAIEGAAYNTGRRKISISFQQMISCNKRNLGCDGGNTAIAVKYAAKNWYGGIASLPEYPFTDTEGETTETCALGGDTPSPPVSVNSAVVVGGLDTSITFEKRLETFKLAVKEKPVAVILKSSCKIFSNYVSGILNEDDDCACSSSHCYDHSVLMVGYNDEDENPYFTFKNSWGTMWGEEGYFRVSQKEVGDYGLFGIFGEGIMVDAEANLDYKYETSELDENEEFSWRWALPIWAIVIIALASCCCCLCCMYLGCVCFQKNTK